MLSGDVSLLAVARSKMKQPGDHMIMPELITKEPAGPAVRQDDARLPTFMSGPSVRYRSHSSATVIARPALR